MALDTATARELYDGLVTLCQQYGFTTEATYEHLHSAVDSILEEPDDDPLDDEPPDMSGPGNPSGDGR